MAKLTLTIDMLGQEARKFADWNRITPSRPSTA